MKKSVKFDLSWRAWSLIVGFFILIGFVGLSFAYNANGIGGNPAIMGHSADEIEGGGSGSTSYAYESSWIPVSIGNVYTVNHNLGKTPSLVQLWFSNTSDGSGDVVLAGSSNYGAYASVVNKINSTSVSFYTGTAYVVYYNDLQKTYKYPTSGYMKVVALSNFVESGSLPTLACRIVNSTVGTIAVASCNSDEIMTSGGGVCQTSSQLLPGCTNNPGGVYAGYLHASYPINKTSWLANCWMGNYEGEVCVQAYAICCK